MRTRSPRIGLTLLELLVVLVLLILLASATLPSFAGLKGNADQKAAMDLLRARIADARGLALQEAATYRLAVNKGGTKIRLAPESADFSHLPASEDAGGGAKVIETTVEKATITVAETEAGAMGGGDEDDWVTIGTFLANGTCREDSTLIEVIESSFPAIRIHLRGVTGTARVLPMDPGASGGMKP